jgi:hypothetical protein
MRFVAGSAGDNHGTGLESEDQSTTTFAEMEEVGVGV